MLVEMPTGPKPTASARLSIAPVRGNAARSAGRRQNKRLPSGRQLARTWRRVRRRRRRHVRGRAFAALVSALLAVQLFRLFAQTIRHLMEVLAMIGFLKVSSISRSAGRSATAATAYRAALLVEDQRTGEIHNYTRRGGVESTHVVGWDGTPAELANALELAERRRDAKVAREVVIALDPDVTPAQRAAQARAYAQWIFQRHGTPSIVCIHTPGRQGDERNFHAHILLATRRCTDGKTLGAKARELDTKATSSRELEAWREEWGKRIDLDMRSHARRGTGIEPEPKAPSPQQRAQMRADRDEVQRLRYLIAQGRNQIVVIEKQEREAADAAARAAARAEREREQERSKAMAKEESETQERVQRWTDQQRTEWRRAQRAAELVEDRALPRVEPAPRRRPGDAIPSDLDQVRRHYGDGFTRRVAGAERDGDDLLVRLDTGSQIRFLGSGDVHVSDVDDDTLRQAAIALKARGEAEVRVVGNDEFVAAAARQLARAGVTPLPAEPHQRKAVEAAAVEGQRMAQQDRDDAKRHRLAADSLRAMSRALPPPGAEMLHAAELRNRVAALAAARAAVPAWRRVLPGEPAGVAAAARRLQDWQEQTPAAVAELRELVAAAQAVAAARQAEIQSHVDAAAEIEVEQAAPAVPAPGVLAAPAAPVPAPSASAGRGPMAVGTPPPGGIRGVRRKGQPDAPKPPEGPKPS